VSVLQIVEDANDGEHLVAGPAVTRAVESDEHADTLLTLRDDRAAPVRGPREQRARCLQQRSAVSGARGDRAFESSRVEALQEVRVPAAVDPRSLRVRLAYVEDNDGLAAQPAEIVRRDRDDVREILVDGSMRCPQIRIVPEEHVAR
jgi:hypothetical protein